MLILFYFIPSKLQSSSDFSTTMIAITVFFSLLCACILIGHFLEEHLWANESITALFLGLISGAVVLLFSKGESSQILVFIEELFFIYLLPPIIFNAGFQVKKKQFFKIFSTIVLFGVLGTIISFSLISVCAFLLFKRIGVTDMGVQDYLAVGAILLATDSVCTLQVLIQDETPFLYSVVFGEGGVNDATSIVLFSAVQSLDFSDVIAMTALSLLRIFLYLWAVVPYSGFSFSAQQIWKVIKENKDLELPAHKVITYSEIVTVRCEEIVNERFMSFMENEVWCELEEATQSEAVKGFQKKLSSILGSCLSESVASLSFLPPPHYLCIRLSPPPQLFAFFFYVFCVLRKFVYQLFYALCLPHCSWCVLSSDDSCVILGHQINRFLLGRIKFPLIWVYNVSWNYSCNDIKISISRDFVNF